MSQAFSKIWIILIIIILSGGGFFARQYFGSLKIKAPGEIVKDETTDWKTYSGVGFSIKYPQDWKVAREESIGLTYLAPEEKRIPENIWVYASVLKKEDLQIQPFYSPHNFFGKPQPYPKKVKIGEREFYKDEEGFEGVRDIKYAIANEDESKIGWISLSIRHGRQAMDYYLSDEEISPELQIFNSMLSTFKFIEGDKTADWKTYKNEKEGFEIKYPSFLEGGDPGCRISEIEDIIFIGPISLIFFNIQGLTLDEWINGEIAKAEEDTKETQEGFRQAGYENWQEFGSKLLSREEIFVDGERAVKLSYQFIGAGFDLPITISIKKENRIYDFRTNDANLVQEECAAKFGEKPSEVMELMLSTFRFLE